MRELTVGLPVHNDPDGLRRSVPSVLSQTWDGPLRLLVVDDGSTDETPAVLEELGERYAGLEVVRSDRNRGRPYARNEIIRRAGDGYLAWIDADDLWHPRKVELQFRALDEVEDDTAVICSTPVRRAWEGHSEQIRRPKVDGDQLHDLIVGTLYPYLPTMLGRAAAFRDAGGFDERLPRRQDYEFFLRFLSRGGRVISTPGPLPLFTYLKTDVGRSGREVAVANRVIAREHVDLYRRYGRRFVRARRAERMRLVARFYEANDQDALARFYRARAEVYAPLEWFVRTRTANRIVRTGRGLVRFAKGGVSGDGTSAPVVTRPEPASASLAELTAAARRDLDAGANERVIDRLSAAVIDDPDGPQHADAWFVLSEAHRRQARPARAREVLQRGLATGAGTAELTTRLLELEGVERAWASVLALWPEVEAHERHHTARTYLMVARAHRAAGDHARAHAVAERGGARWPGDRRLRDELYRCRAALTDWARAVHLPPAPIPLADRPDDRGAVTDLGFLAGGESALRGWVSPAFGRAPVVSLRLNGRDVATTHAATPTGEDGTLAQGTFSLACHDLLGYVGDGDTLTVHCEDETLALGPAASRAVVVTGFPSRANELLTMLRAGHVFTKFGRLRQGNTVDSKRLILELFAEVSGVIDRHLGYGSFPMYGNLLGAVRDNDFIKHDVGGFDMSYLSRHAAGVDVRAEFLDLCRALLAEGYDLRVEPWSVMVRRHPRDTRFMDINYGWFTEQQELQFSFGWRYAPVTDRAAFLSPRTSPIAGHLVPVPGNAEAVLEQLYGRDWPIPDQGFDLDAHLRRSPDHLLTTSELEALRDEAPDHVRIMHTLGADGEAVVYETAAG